METVESDKRLPCSSSLQSQPMKSAILRGVMSVSFARSPKYLQEPPTVAHRARASLLHKVVDLARLGDIRNSQRGPLPDAPTLMRYGQQRGWAVQQD